MKYQLYFLLLLLPLWVGCQTGKELSVDFTDIEGAANLRFQVISQHETDLSKVEFDLTLFESFAKGFYEEVKDVITQREKELLVLSAKLMTYECGIRFLTDYLNGDTYFRIHRENHNLDRARTQFKLVRDIEKKSKEMEAIINSL